MNLLEYYQNIPLHLNPTAVTVGFFSLKWYSTMYLVGFLVVYFLLKWRVNNDQIRGESQIPIFKSQISLTDLLLVAMAGAIIGGRLGYILFYNCSYFLQNPVAMISPYDLATGKLIGIYGMSYHGGVMGIVAAVLIFARKRKLNFWKLADFVVPAIPAGYFFGRIGNFLNLELYGRVTDSWWGMYFPVVTDMLPVLRYPSQLLEAFLEGLLLFVILWSLRNKDFFSGSNLAAYLIGYGVFRIAVEFFREPDAQIGLISVYFTLGQIFSLGMILIGLAIYFRRKKYEV